MQETNYVHFDYHLPSHDDSTNAIVQLTSLYSDPHPSIKASMQLGLRVSRNAYIKKRFLQKTIKGPTRTFKFLFNKTEEFFRSRARYLDGLFAAPPSVKVLRDQAGSPNERLRLQIALPPFSGIFIGSKTLMQAYGFDGLSHFVYSDLPIPNERKRDGYVAYNPHAQVQVNIVSRVSFDPQGIIKEYLARLQAGSEGKEGGDDDDDEDDDSAADDGGDDGEDDDDDDDGVDDGGGDDDDGGAPPKSKKRKQASEEEEEDSNDDAEIEPPPAIPIPGPVPFVAGIDVENVYEFAGGGGGGAEDAEFKEAYEDLRNVALQNQGDSQHAAPPVSGPDAHGGSGGGGGGSGGGGDDDLDSFAPRVRAPRDTGDANDPFIIGVFRYSEDVYAPARVFQTHKGGHKLSSELTKFMSQYLKEAAEFLNVHSLGEVAELPDSVLAFAITPPVKSLGRPMSLLLNVDGTQYSQLGFPAPALQLPFFAGGPVRMAILDQAYTTDIQSYFPAYVTSPDVELAKRRNKSYLHGVGDSRVLGIAAGNSVSHTVGFILENIRSHFTVQLYDRQLQPIVFKGPIKVFAQLKINRFK